MLQKIRDPISCLTHLAGALAALACTAALTYKALPLGRDYIVSFLIFGVSLILLYSASSVYHMLHVSEKTRLLLRRIDHSMIFVFIAGTYTPVCLITLRGAWGWAMLALVWSLAVAGCFMKIFWMHGPRKLSTAIYVIMGWVVVFAFQPLISAVSTLSLVFLIAGGLSYTVGAAVYAAKWPRSLEGRLFGFHEIFHLFVLLGSFFHVLFMFRLLPDKS